jgi:hypothetical protein
MQHGLRTVGSIIQRNVNIDQSALAYVIPVYRVPSWPRMFTPNFERLAAGSSNPEQWGTLQVCGTLDTRPPLCGVLMTGLGGTASFFLEFVCPSFGNSTPWQVGIRGAFDLTEANW